MKRFTCFSILLLGYIVALAGNVSRHQAAQKAEIVLSTLKHKTVSIIQPASQAKNAFASGNTNAGYYVCNASDGQGYVLISADDKMPAVLGYSLTGNWPTDETQLPPALRQVLENYGSYASAVKAGLILPYVTSDTDDTQVVVSPLLTTQWGQDYPYNKFAPVSDTADKDGVSYASKYAVGCAATAMAQILHYWKAQLTKSRDTAYSFTQNTNGVLEEKTAYEIISNEYPYRHDYMPDAISITKPEDMTQEHYDSCCNEVGVFCCDAAKLLNMYWKDGMGSANTMTQISALTDMYGMTYSIGYKNLTFTDSGTLKDDGNWQLIQTDLDNKRPVLIAGYDTTKKQVAGHSFVFDGYDSNNYVHVNWGWNGECNNWFDPSLLITNQYDRVTGPDYNFSCANEIIYNIQPKMDAVNDTLSAEKIPSYTSSIPRFHDISDFNREVINNKYEILDRTFPYSSRIILYSPYLDHDVDFESKFDMYGGDDAKTYIGNFIKYDVGPIYKNFGNGCYTLYGTKKGNFTLDKDIVAGDYTLRSFTKTMYGGQTTDWIDQNDTYQIRIDEKHCIRNPSEYDKYYHEPDCIHYSKITNLNSPDGNVCTYADICYDSNPEATPVNDSIGVTIFYGLYYSMCEPDSIFADYNDPAQHILFSITDPDGNVLKTDTLGNNFYVQMTYSAQSITETLRYVVRNLKPGKYHLSYRIDAFKQKIERDIIVIDKPSAIRNLEPAEKQAATESSSCKKLVNGHIVIEKNGKQYNATGQILK